MGKSKGGARRKGGKGDAAKVAAKASSTLSKRQEKKSRGAQGRGARRKGALLSQLETRKAADAAAARGPLLGGSLGLDLDDALAEVAAAPGAPGQEPAERGEQPRPARDCGAGDGALRGRAEGCTVPCRSIGSGAGALAAAGCRRLPPSGRRKKGVSSVFCARPLLRMSAVNAACFC